MRHSKPARSHRADGSKRPALGRVFSVRRESWRLKDDPQAVSPQVEVLASRRTASDAADIARDAALAFRRHGFDKATRAWWGADRTSFHRFRVEGPKPRPALAIAVVSAVAGLAVLTVLGARRKSSKQQAGRDG
ncbi:hypothetical protein [Phenylobacterium sp.]|uniref:hypothetical protein n=1 Tax=Phenylobacterium sp. TaxID=1871053 RepID=UPI002ED8F7F9